MLLTVDVNIMGESSSSGLTFVFAIWRQVQYMSLRNLANLTSMLQLIDNNWCTAKTFQVKLAL